MNISDVNSPYDPDGECVLDICFRIFFANNVAWPSEIDRKIAKFDILDLMNLFFENGFNANFSIGNYSKIMNFTKFVSNKGKFLEIDDFNRRFSEINSYYLYSGTFNSIYGISENYIHFLCLCNFNGRISKYDGLLNTLKKEYDIIKVMSASDIMKLPGNRILVWR